MEQNDIAANVISLLIYLKRNQCINGSAVLDHFLHNSYSFHPREGAGGWKGK